MSLKSTIVTENRNFLRKHNYPIHKLCRIAYRLKNTIIVLAHVTKIDIFTKSKYFHSNRIKNFT